MSHYDEVLQEARSKATHSAKEYIPRLYHILVEEEHKTPEDARKIIEHDLIEYWSKATVTKFLPHEAKDEEKVKAGKKGAEATNLILAGGQTVTTPADGQNSGKDWSDELPPNSPTKTSEQFYKEQESIPSEPVGKKELEYMDKIPEEEEPTPLELANIKIAQLEDALHKTEQFKPATQLQPKTGLESQMISGFEDMFQAIMKKADGVNSFYYDAYGIDLFKNRELAQLKNSGVKTFKRLYFEV